MDHSDVDPSASMLRKLKRLADLDEADHAAIAALPSTIETAPAGHYLIRDGETARDCYALISGYACRYKADRDGRRQIVSFHLRGDVLDLQHLLLCRADHAIQLITEATYARIPLIALRRVARERPNISDALWRDGLLDAAIFREWILNVGQREPTARIAHMLCEFAARQEAAGLGGPERTALPLANDAIADATGLTFVHVNRSLKAMTEDEIIRTAGRGLEILDWERMQRRAGFDPIYLHAVA